MEVPVCVKAGSQNQKEWAHLRISPLPWTSCVLHNLQFCNSSWSELPARFCGRDIKWRWMQCASSAAWRMEKDQQCTQTSVWIVMDSATARKRPTTTQSPLSHTKKKTKALSAAGHERQQNYDQSQAGTWIHIGYTLAHGGNFNLIVTENRCWHGSYPCN